MALNKHLSFITSKYFFMQKSYSSFGVVLKFCHDKNRRISKVELMGVTSSYLSSEIGNTNDSNI